MKKMMFAALAGVMAAGAVQAQTNMSTSADTAPHAYMGISTGVAKDSITNDHKRTTKVFGGYEFDQNWGVEAGYSWLGKSGFYVPLGANDYAYTHVKSSSYYAAAKYTLPLTERSSVYGKLGLSHSEQKYSSQAPGWNFSDSGNGVYAAIGVQAKVTEHISLFAEYERNGKRPMNGADSKVFNAGVKVGF